MNIRNDNLTRGILRPLGAILVAGMLFLSACDPARTAPNPPEDREPDDTVPPGEGFVPASKHFGNFA